MNVMNAKTIKLLNHAKGVVGVPVKGRDYFDGGQRRYTIEYKRKVVKFWNANRSRRGVITALAKLTDSSIPNVRYWVTQYHQLVNTNDTGVGTSVSMRTSVSMHTAHVRKNISLVEKAQSDYIKAQRKLELAEKKLDQLYMMEGM